MGKIKDSNIPTTNQPQGGWRPPSRPIDAKHAAAGMQAGNFDGVIELLGGKTAPDDIQTAQGHSALMASVTHDAVQVAERLLRAGANPNRSPNSPHDSTYIGCVLRRLQPGFNQPMLALLLREGADPSLPISSCEPTPLAYAVAHGLVGPAAMLVRWGADPLGLDTAATSSDAPNSEHPHIHIGRCPVDLALALPECQKVPLLWALFPPPIDPRLMERVLARFGPDEAPLASWLAQTWTTDPSR